MTVFTFMLSAKSAQEALISYIFFLEGWVEVLNALYILGRFYKGLLFTKLVFDQLPLFNPYKWPLSIVRILTDPWFRFWRTHFPPARIAGYAFELSGLIAFEVFEIFLKGVSFLKMLLISKLDMTLSLIN